jgi:hypothetical protein
LGSFGDGFSDSAFDKSVRAIHESGREIAFLPIQRLGLWQDFQRLRPGSGNDEQQPGPSAKDKFLFWQRSHQFRQYSFHVWGGERPRRNQLVDSLAPPNCTPTRISSHSSRVLIESNLFNLCEFIRCQFEVRNIEILLHVLPAARSG